MTEPTASEDLDELPTEELRRRAFHLAESRRDLRFFWDLMRHLPATRDGATEDGSSGGIAGGIGELVELVREMSGKGYGDAELLMRARFLDYLRAHPGR